mmetsp:Transcript_17855/g.46492  ORF Transcript_17855/g.46492 Transcript_17855/m.46492 type:complete len:202 (+) Transcript_17855:1105-1710(+)
MTPAEYTSACEPYCLRTTSGARNKGVPVTAVSGLSSALCCTASPKSVAFTRLDGDLSENRKLTGFTSRYTIPLAAHCAKKRSTERMMSATSCSECAGVSPGFSSGPPSQSSMMMCTCSSSSNTSLRAAASRDAPSWRIASTSARMRSRWCGVTCPVRGCRLGMLLQAYCTPFSFSAARYTCAKPPFPISSMMAYLSRRFRG